MNDFMIVVEVYSVIRFGQGWSSEFALKEITFAFPDCNPRDSSRSILKSPSEISHDSIPTLFGFVMRK
jgi:hypothetical protein